MDQADIASEHDFSQEKLDELRKAKQKEVKRGTCLYCNAPLQPVQIALSSPPVVPLYCDAGCRLDYEAEQTTLNRQRRS